MKTAVFIDGNWLLHRSYFTIGKQSAFPERALPLRMLDSCSKFALQVGATFGAMAFDGPNNFRYKVYPKYKSSRSGSTHSGEVVDESSLVFDHTQSSSKEEVYRHLDAVMDLFQSVGFPVVQMDEFEADDLVSSGAHRFALQDEGHESWIVCRDKDSYQDIRSRVRVLWPEQGNDPERIMDKNAVIKKFGMTPVQFGDYQVLIGDGVDDIPGVVTPAAAKKLLRDHGSLKNYLRTPEGKKFFYENDEELRRNMKLIRMDKRCWLPEESEISLTNVKDSKYAFKTFGKLPAAFNQLVSSNKPRQSLFGKW